MTIDLTERMTALVKQLADSTYLYQRCLQEEARAIVAALPAPVDPVVLACREVTKAWIRERGSFTDLAEKAYRAGQESKA